MTPTEPDRSRIHAAYEAVVARLVDLGDPDTAETVRQLHRAYCAEVDYSTAVRATLTPAAVAVATTGEGRHARA
ncbi:hypothetical protein [Nocardia paucivorans]|uniref:hypothetical protein n=1 Tax=Nocardia paucivorans TaxID=114259 RepID=UPI0002F57DFD|nr:hypothetical protein [Nocardia paucivorans]